MLQRQAYRQMQLSYACGKLCQRALNPGDPEYPGATGALQEEGGVQTEKQATQFHGYTQQRAEALGKCGVQDECSEENSRG